MYSPCCAPCPQLKFLRSAAVICSHLLSSHRVVLEEQGEAIGEAGGIWQGTGSSRDLQEAGRGGHRICRDGIPGSPASHALSLSSLSSSLEKRKVEESGGWRAQLQWQHGVQHGVCGEGWEGKAEQQHAGWAQVLGELQCPEFSPGREAQQTGAWYGGIEGL